MKSVLIDPGGKKDRFSAVCAALGLLLWGYGALAQIDSRNAATSGGSASTSSNYQAQGGFLNGLGIGFQSSANYGAGSGFSATIINPPHASGVPGNIVADEGASIEVTYDDLLTVTTVVDVDGDPITFTVEASSGTMLQNGSEIAQALVAPGESFTWEPPLESEDPDPFLIVTPNDGWVDISSPIEIDGLTTLEASLAISTDTSEVSESTDLDYGDAEVSADGTDQTYTISNTVTENASLFAEPGPASGLRSRTLGVNPLSRAVESLVISEIKISGLNPGDFQISGIQLPITLAPGESTTFVVTFKPAQAGERRADIEVFRQGSNRKLFGFGVRGRGNRPPTGGNDEVYRRPGLAPFRIPLADLLANDSDIDGDPVSFGGFSEPTSKNGRNLSLDGEYILYFPGAPDETPDDSFVYRVTDGRGATAPSVVWLRDAAIQGPGDGFRLRSIINRFGRTELSVIGELGHIYQFQYTEEFTEPFPIWTNLGTAVTATEAGALVRFFVEDLSSARRFFRVIDLPPAGNPGGGGPGGGGGNPPDGPPAGGN